MRLSIIWKAEAMYECNTFSKFRVVVIIVVTLLLRICLKAVFQLRVFYMYVHARRSVNPF